MLAIKHQLKPIAYEETQDSMKNGKVRQHFPVNLSFNANNMI
jgi:hypothetical protein